MTHLKLLAAVVAALIPGLVWADAPAVALGSTRSHFASHEPIELIATAGPIHVRHEDGSVISIDVPAGGATRVITIKPSTLKPGKYSASAGGSQAQFSVALPEHKNAYYTGEWVHHNAAIANALAKGGWMYMNTDYVPMHPRTPKAGDIAEGYVAASMKPFTLMVLGGGHQLDLDLENDWGDPWVQRAVVWRVQLAALSNRIYPIGGLHIFDEPGLTWWPTSRDEKGAGKDPSPFAIPHQLDEFKKLTGKEIPYGPFDKTLPLYKPMMQDWLAFMDMRMKYLEQTWHGTVWATQSVVPHFLTINQVSSSYAPHDVTDGVDSRQNRPYEIVSGHGQYSDLPFGTMQPVRGFESYQGFTWDRPHIYVPMWYTHSWASVRNGVWMSWIAGADGMIYTPEHDFAMGTHRGYLGTLTVLEIAEVNRRLALLGGVMNQLPKQLSPVAVLQSHTQAAWDIAEQNHPKVVAQGAPPYVSKHRDAINASFFRVLNVGIIPNSVDEVEVVEKGVEFFKQWKVVFCPALTYATPQFKKILEQYVAGGGKLVQFKGDTLQIAGAIQADHTNADATAYYMALEAKKKQADERKQAGDQAGSDALINEVILATTDLAIRKWVAEGAPNLKKELAQWIGPQPYASSNSNVILATHSAGEAKYLLLANNEQSEPNPRGVKHELIASQTSVTVPAGGVVYDLLNGGKASVTNGAVQLKLGAGDGAALLHLPADPGPIKLTAAMREANRLIVSLDWGSVGYLPFRLRIFDPAGNVAGDYLRATTPADGTTSFQGEYALGINAAPGTWRIEASEWLNGTSESAEISLAAPASATWASADGDTISIYFDDERRIADLVAGKIAAPDFSLLNHAFARVWGVQDKKFAVFAPDASAPAAERIAKALRDKGMSVEVNPAYEIKPFEREPDRGGAGPRFRTENFENIHAHTIVLNGHPLIEKSMQRGHINRLTDAVFPGTGRAYVQWGSSCYQAGWQNVFLLGDIDAGVQWLVSTIGGQQPAAARTELTTQLAPATAQTPKFSATFSVASQIKTYDTPVGIGVANGRTFVALHDGSVAAYDPSGKQLWNTPVLLEGCAMAVSPKGDRLAIAGYPGLSVLDAKNGKILNGFKATHKQFAGNPILANRMVAVAWNGAGTRVAGGWSNNITVAGPRDIQPFVILDADGKAQSVPQGIDGNVMGVAFVPNSDTLLVGADKLVAINTANGQVLWSNDLKGAQAFGFSADGTTAAAGGWDKRAAVFALSDGKITASAGFDAVVGGVALLPGNDLAVAVWGGTRPLMLLRSGAEKPEPLFQSRFGFQDVIWSAARSQLLAAEQGGNLWALTPDGKPAALLDEEAGTTIYRLQPQGDDLLVGRMNRVVQRINTN